MEEKKNLAQDAYQHYADGFPCPGEMCFYGLYRDAQAVRDLSKRKTVIVSELEDELALRGECFDGRVELLLQLMIVKGVVGRFGGRSGARCPFLLERGG